MSPQRAAGAGKGPAADELIIRDAVKADVPAIVAMYADDGLGAGRERPGEPLDEAYWTAFRSLENDPASRLVVAESGGEVVATLQLTFVPHLVLQGTTRAQIEAVRVRADRRGSGVGHTIIAWAIARAQERGCGLVQLTTNGQRTGARNFYEALGFEPTHIGMKLVLDRPSTQ